MLHFFLGLALCAVGPAGAIDVRAPIDFVAPRLPTMSVPLTPSQVVALPNISAVSETGAVPLNLEQPQLAASGAPEAALPGLQAQFYTEAHAEAGAAHPPVETEAFGGQQKFDGSGWSHETFESPAGGDVAYKKRDGGSGSTRVYAGGLSLNESFDPLFASKRAPTGPEYFMWTRGHPPTGWTHTKSPLDADARDLARMIVLAGENSPTGKVELALHSFGTLVFQRMVQLRGEPEVKDALRLLAGSRVVLLHATTHYEGSERKAGPEFEQMGMGARMFVDWLDGTDAASRPWEEAARFNPLAGFLLAQWRAQREQALALAAKGAADMTRQDLAEPWDLSYDHIRKEMIAALARDSKNPGWQEALLRRSSDMFRLEMTKKDVDFIRRLGMSLDLVHAAGDKLLNWASAKILFDLLGIHAPDHAPSPGTVLRDRTGRFSARIVDGDHYFPLKKPDELAAILDK